ncbi:uncharacterized protein J3D65DRAFT_685283 [Phyllosticta citribraziliensis]|uniref:Secreted protein n=1 Tax=Phyllosticta citribraziliensis TaxID=989973 RepID=A0ABR1LC65_9PEZI
MFKALRCRSVGILCCLGFMRWSTPIGPRALFEDSDNECSGELDEQRSSCRSHLDGFETDEESDVATSRFDGDEVDGSKWVNMPTTTLMGAATRAVEPIRIAVPRETRLAQTKTTNETTSMRTGEAMRDAHRNEEDETSNEPCFGYVTFAMTCCR